MGSECTAIRAVVVSFSNVAPRAQDIELFSCKVRPPASTPAGTHLLTVEHLEGADELGYRVSLSMSDGFVAVEAAAPASACPGDCDDDGQVTIDELVLSTRIALGDSSGARTCTAADADRDQRIEVNELVGAVSAALVGC